MFELWRYFFFDMIWNAYNMESEFSLLSVWLTWCFWLCLFCRCGCCCRLRDLCWFVNLCWFDDEICELLFVNSDLLKQIDEKCSFLPRLLHVLYRLRLQSFARCPFLHNVYIGLVVSMRMDDYVDVVLIDVACMPFSHLHL